MQIYINFYQLLYLSVYQVKISGHILSQNNSSGWPAPHDDNATYLCHFFICYYMRYGKKLDPSVAINS